MPTTAVSECNAYLLAHPSFHHPLNKSNQNEANLHDWEQ